MHDLLDINAYWVLGLPGNATRRDIVTAAGRLRLRLRAGRTPDEKDPLTAHLGYPRISVTDLDTLVRRLEDPVYRLEQRLLRYTRATPADEIAWKAMLLPEGEEIILVAWSSPRHLDVRLNRARWYWWSCFGRKSGVVETRWARSLALWGRLARAPGLFRALAPEALEATFGNPATKADFEAVVERIPDFLAFMFDHVLVNAGDVRDVLPMAEAVRDARFPDAWTRRLLERLWQPFLRRLEQAVNGLEDSVEAIDCGKAILRQVEDLRKLGGGDSPLVQRLRRRAGKELHAEALAYERTSLPGEALAIVKMAVSLLAGTPDGVPVTVDAARIEASAKKAAALPPPAPAPTRSAPAPIRPAPIPLVPGPSPVSGLLNGSYFLIFLFCGALFLFSLATGEPENRAADQRPQKLYSPDVSRAPVEEEETEPGEFDEEDAYEEDEGEEAWNE